MKKLLIATRNAGKFDELKALLDGAPYELVSLSDVGIDEDVDETGDTLEDNAILKATAYARLSGLLTLSDDSGLEVDALGGEPGVRSSRYAGDGATDAERIAFLHKKLQATGVPPKQWSARFRCVIAIALPSTESPELYEGEVNGKIIGEARGASGFGYDPVFFIPELGKTMAELSPEEKNGISHRSAAARKAAAALRRKSGGS